MTDATSQPWSCFFSNSSWFLFDGAQLFPLLHHIEMTSSQQSLSKILGGDVNLYIGGKQDAKAKDVLQSLKISYILNCTPPRAMDPETGCQNFFEKEKAFVYKRIPVFDNRGEDLLKHMEESYRFIEEGKHYGGVLVHCHKGISRSASFVIGYLMKKNELSLNEALDYIQSIRSIVQPNLAFMTQLRAYELQLENERNAAAANNSSSSSSSSEHHRFSSMGPSVSAGPSMGPCIGPSTGPGPSTEPSTSSGPSLPGVDTETIPVIIQECTATSSTTTVSSIGPSGPPVGPPTNPNNTTSSIDIIDSPIGPTIGPASGPPIVVAGPKNDTDDDRDQITNDDQPSKRAKLNTANHT